VSNRRKGIVALALVASVFVSASASAAHADPINPVVGKKDAPTTPGQP